MSGEQDMAAIAAGLTEPQRRALVHAWPYPDYHRSGEQVSYCAATINTSGSAALDRRRLTATLADGGPRLTPLGLAVRAHLLSDTPTQVNEGDR